MSDPHGTQWFDLPLPDLTSEQRQRLHQALQGEGIPASWGGSTVRVDPAYEARLTTLVAEVRTGTGAFAGTLPPPPGSGTGAPPSPALAAHQAPRTNSMAVLSLVLGIASLFVCALTGPFGLWAGVRARREVRTSGEQGDGLALAGIITSLIGLAILVFALALAAVLVIAAVASSS